MIIEFLGPPAVGKTTLATALARRLEEAGQRTALVLSDRPAETSPEARSGIPPRTRLPAPLRRLLRPAGTTTAMVRQVLIRSPEAQTIAEVMAILPPRTVLSALRLRQYLLRLLLAWSEAVRAGRVTLFDQGCAQAVCSLALQADSVESARLSRALQLLPAADLVVRVAAPPSLIEARLRARRQNQGLLERTMERSVEGSLAFLPVIDSVDLIMRDLGRRVVSASAVGEAAQRTSLARLSREVAGLQRARISA
jgi:DNA polymerase III delta prime subunit